MYAVQAPINVRFCHIFSLNTPVYTSSQEYFYTLGKHYIHEYLVTFMKMLFYYI